MNSGPHSAPGQRPIAASRGTRLSKLLLLSLAAALMLLAASALTGIGLYPSAKADPGPGQLGLAPLNTIAVPRPANIGDFVKDRAAAIKLGKAFYWDMQVGSDGVTACATCHFSAGVDLRSRNTLNPRVGPFVVNGPNFQLSAADFPFHRLADPNNRDSTVLFDTDNVVGSQGVIPSTFVAIEPGSAVDKVVFAPTDPIFNVNGVNVRRSTGRNTPTNISAIFNHRNFWDGRAQNDFNGVTPFGSRDQTENAKVAQVNLDGSVSLVRVSIPNASPASQAVGPPGNDVEMSAAGRTLRDIGHKLFALQPLGEQQVSATDSVLGAHVDPVDGKGLTASYQDLVKQAFQNKWWDAPETVLLTDPDNGRQYTVMEYNFSLFWGLAILEWTSTLVPDQSRVDQFLAGTGALTPQEQDGMSVFGGKGRCNKCHGGPETTNASVRGIETLGTTDSTSELLPDGSTTNVTFDTGFANIGVRPTASDPGNGGNDPFGNPLSITRLNGLPDNGVQGSFKIATFRNLELTAPYFHNGGTLTLDGVVDFYSRGGDFANAELNPNIRDLALSQEDKDALVAFLRAFTDERVRNQSGPFDHPELFVPAGHQVNPDGSIQTDAAGVAVDCFLRIPATGAAGGAPFPTFASFQFTGPPCGPDPEIVRGSPPAPEPVVVLGNGQLEPSVDFNPAGMAEAFRTTATDSGTVETLRVFIDASSTATKLVVGLYGDAADHPGSLLAQGTLDTPVAGAWNDVQLAVGASVTAGQNYWIALLGPDGSGTVRFRDRCCGGGTPAETSAQTALTGLPASWTTGSRFADGPLSAVGLSGGSAPAPEPAPAPAPAPAPVVLIGDQVVEPSTDFNPAGLAEAFKRTATASGTVTTLNVFVDPLSSATTLAAGLYTDAAGHPGTLLAQGTLAAPIAGAWNAVSIPGALVTAGEPYWIALLGPSGAGTLRFRDGCCGGGTPAETSAQTALTGLPASWSTGSVFSDGPLSAFGSG